MKRGLTETVSLISPASPPPSPDAHRTLKPRRAKENGKGRREASESGDSLLTSNRELSGATAKSPGPVSVTGNQHNTVG